MTNEQRELVEKKLGLVYSQDRNAYFLGYFRAGYNTQTTTANRKWAIFGSIEMFVKSISDYFSLDTKFEVHPFSKEIEKVYWVSAEQLEAMFAA